MASKKAKSSEAKQVITRWEAANGVPAGYRKLLDDMKTDIRAAQIKASLAVNRELVTLHWYIGRTIVERQRTDGWDESAVERFAVDLGRAFPGVAGFSPTNVRRMRTFYLAWSEEILAQLAPELGKPAIQAQPVPKLQDQLILAQAVRELGKSAIQSQPVTKLGNSILPQVVSELPWGHNIVLLEKLKTPDVRLWYAQQATVNGWSRSMLEHWIESDLYGQRECSVPESRKTSKKKTTSKSKSKNRRGRGRSQS